MPRPQSASRQELVDNAMPVFWRHGFHATSLDKLVQATGVSRGSIYAEHKGKTELFEACLGVYQGKFVEPAIGLLQKDGNGLDAIEAYLDHFINLHRRHGLPGPGCFFANTMTELATDQTGANAVVRDHSEALAQAFHGALLKANNYSLRPLDAKDLQELSVFLVSATQGMWSYARSISEIDDLIRCKRTLLGLLQARFGH